MLGLGRFGGGVGVVRFLSERGFAVEVVDDADRGSLEASEATVRGLPGVTLRLGAGSSDAAALEVAGVALLVVNPAVKPGHFLWAAAEGHRVPVTTEVGLLVSQLPEGSGNGPVIGVTGSAGKSTTSSMAALALAQLEGIFGVRTADGLDGGEGAYGVFLGGNLGGSLLPHTQWLRHASGFVLELSSFMCFHLDRLGWSPEVAVLTNLSPNHLDWHGGFEAYAEAKRGLFAHQRPGDRAVLPEGMDASFVRPGVEVVRVGAPPPDLPGLRVPGGHNRLNAAFALAAARPRTADAGGRFPRRSAALEALAGFRGLPHRLQAVEGGSGWPAGVRFFDDSKATTPEAAALAIEAFEPGTARVVLGGADKGSDLGGLGRLAGERAAGVYAIGLTGDAIADAAEGSSAVVRRCGTLAAAVAAIRADARAGEVVLLSPGCASWDQFPNYEARGAAFAAAVIGA